MIRSLQRTRQNWFSAALLALVLGVAATSKLSAQTMGVDFDPSKTRIEYTLGDVLHTVHGTFQLKSGHVEVNRENRAISGLLVVDASSGESGSGARDGRMKKNILEVGKYPEITFVPTAIESDFGQSGTQAAGSVKVTGWFAIHGDRHQISIPVDLKKTGEQVSTVCKFEVPYVAWGMKNPSTFLLRVNEEVQIQVTAIGSFHQSAK